MTIRCPGCATDYLLPDPLVGAGGARVRCPSCQEVFAVSRAPDAAREPSVPPPEAMAEPAAAAEAVFDVLESILGDALARSRARGTVLADHGPAILAVWEEYRRRAGAAAPTRIFRAALRDRCGVDLTVAS